MWKKIVLGIIIGTVVLTVSAGGIYAFQRNAGQGSDFLVENYKESADFQPCAVLKCSGQGNCTEANCPDGNCDGDNCNNPGGELEKNCYRQNYENCNQLQTQSGFCFQNNIQNNNKNQNRDEHCGMSGNNTGQVNYTEGNNVKNCFGKNK